MFYPLGKISLERNQMDNNKALSKVAEEITTCAECQKDTIGKAVPGEGDPHAEVVFVGEAPGKQEAATGRSFIGRSGELLRKTMEEIGLHPEDVFITSTGKYLPKNGTPTTSQITHGTKHLMRQLAIIQPKVTVLLGSVAAQGVLQEKVPVKSLHGTTRIKDSKAYFLTIHPAAALRFPPLKKVFLGDFHILQQLLKEKSIL